MTPKFDQKVEQFFALMDANGDKKVNRAEMNKFFSTFDVDNTEQKLTGFMGQKDALTLEDMRNFYR